MEPCRTPQITHLVDEQCPLYYWVIANIPKFLSNITSPYAKLMCYGIFLSLEER